MSSGHHSTGDCWSSAGLCVQGKSSKSTHATKFCRNGHPVSHCGAIASGGILANLFIVYTIIIILL